VNGKEVGPLPQEVKNLRPGEHDVKVVGGSSFEDWTQKITVSADKVADLGSVKLNVKEGTATIKLGKNAKGAKVLFVCGQQPGRVLDEKYYAKGVKLPSEGCKIIAQRKGFADVSQAVTFEPGEPARTFTIDFARKAKTAAPRTRPRVQPRPIKPRPVKPPEPPREKATATGTLNINSIPPSAVVLDGRPLGKTPRIGVKVKPGRHTVVFIHRKYGKRVKKITVKEGKRSAAIVNFKKKKK
jgi:serine/threonine-protein kinase